MKTLDEKSEEYTSRLVNQGETYTRGEIETAYVTGASENEELAMGESGDFGKALRSLKTGKCVARKEWGDSRFVVKQVNSEISPSVVPVMQSLPDSAKELISNSGNGYIHYREQCLLVYPYKNGASLATNYIPDWFDMFADDWVIVS